MKRYLNLLKRREGILAIFTIAFFFVLYFTTNFSSAVGLQAYFRDVAYMLIASTAMTLLFLTGNTDLSMGTTMGLAGYAAAFVAKNYQAEWYVYIPIAIVVGIIFASITGIIVTVFKVPAMVASLALITMHMGLFTLLPAGGWVENMEPNFTFLGSSLVFGVPLVLIIAILVFVAVVLFMKFSRFGRKIYAVGGNSNAAVLAGVKIDKTVFLTYAFAGLLVGVATVLFYTNKQMVQANSSYGMEMLFITATVVGGTSVAGGRGSLWGTLVGAFLVGLLNRAIIFYGFQDYYSYALQGTVILIAVLTAELDLKSLGINRGKILAETGRQI